MTIENNKEQKNLMMIYGAFIISVVLNFIPSYAAQLFGAILFFVLLIAAYVFRAKAQEDSLQKNHMQYVIKSIWISSLFLLIGMIAAIFLADHSLINSAVQQMQGGTILSENDINVILSDYSRSNIGVLALCILPSIFYLFYRLVKGFFKVKNNQIITNLKSWI